jgi:putative endonuclease
VGFWVEDKTETTLAAPHWYVAVLRCVDGALVTDVGDDVDELIGQINAGRGMPYTKSRLPVFLVHSEEYMNKEDAQGRAVQIRAMSKAQKERMLAELSVGAMERAGARGGIMDGLRTLSDIFR